MKNALLIKSLFLGVSFTLINNGCSVNDQSSSKNPMSIFSKKNNEIRFTKCAHSNWNNKIVEVSFEDAFQEYYKVDSNNDEDSRVGYALSENNLRQGLTIKLRVIDTTNKTEKISEIMVESFDLEKGKNQFTIGYKDKSPYIIYN